VTLTATNDCGSVTTTQIISIVAPPVAAFSADVTIGCAPFTVQFFDESLNAASWSWSFPGGMPSSSTEQNPIVIYNTPGNYSVTLEVSNTAGTNTLTITEYISVEDIPQPSFSSNITGSIGIFTNTSNGGTSFEWDFGDGTGSTEENPMHVYEEDGDYTVTLTVTNSCGSVSTSQDIIIATPPNANFSADVTEGCVPFTVQFNDQSTTNTVSWQWEFPGGTPNSSTEQNPVVVYNTAGTYDVTLTVSNPAGSDESVQLSYIVVNDAPLADFSTDVNGITATFTNNTANGGNYDWDFGDGESSTETNPEHEYQIVGDYEVQLIVTNECGADTVVQIISIEGLAPTAAFSTDEQSGCAPFTVNFIDESTENPNSWDWTFEGGNPSSSTDQNPTVVYETAGTYEVTLTASNVFGENTITETSYITVLTTPVASFDYDDEGGTVTFDNTTTGSTSWQWDFGDGESSTEENPIHNYTATGEYNVVLIATNECGSTTVEMTVQVIVTGIEDFENIEIFNVFPNPNNGNFTLVLEGIGADDLKLEIYNILGQSIYNELIDFRNGYFTKEYSFNNTAAGTYILQLKSGEKVMYKKFVIER
jgi:PKD repeat protein